MMARTRVTKQGGCYNILDPKQFTEHITLFFGKGDNEVIEFTWNEKTGIAVHDKLPNEILDEIENEKSIRYLFSSSYGHNQQKPHDERVDIARHLAALNERDDMIALRDVYLVKSEKFKKLAEGLDGQIEDESTESDSQSAEA